MMGWPMIEGLLHLCVSSAAGGRKGECGVLLLEEVVYPLLAVDAGE